MAVESRNEWRPGASRLADAMVSVDGPVAVPHGTRCRHRPLLALQLLLEESARYLVDFYQSRQRNHLLRLRRSHVEEYRSVLRRGKLHDDGDISQSSRFRHDDRQLAYSTRGHGAPMSAVLQSFALPWRV